MIAQRCGSFTAHWYQPLVNARLAVALAWAQLTCRGMRAAHLAVSCCLQCCWKAVGVETGLKGTLLSVPHAA